MQDASFARSLKVGCVTAFSLPLEIVAHVCVLAARRNPES